MKGCRGPVHPAWAAARHSTGMTAPDLMDLTAVHERLGLENATDYEAQVMRDVLLRLYPGRALDSVNESEWLTAYGEMNLQKETGWLGETTATSPVAREKDQNTPVVDPTDR